MHAPAARIAGVTLLLLVVSLDLAATDRFSADEQRLRATLATRPSDRGARIGLARIHLWRGHYRDAEHEFAALVRELPSDAAAALGWAQAAYWSGDFRTARRRFQRVMALDAGNAEARKALEDLRAVMAPRYEVRGSSGDDSQPMQRTSIAAQLRYFSDPLTRWDVSVSNVRLEGSRGASLGVRTATGGVTAGIPPLRLTLAAAADRIAFDDDTTETLGHLSATWRARRGDVILAVDQSPLLGTVSSIAAREKATSYRLTWRHEPESGWQSAANLHRVIYSDQNRGSGADAYALMPLGAEPYGVRLRAGLSAAWRDTDEDRFRFTSFRFRPLSAGYEYRFSGVYDPYWTPIDLRETRVIVAASRAFARARIAMQADAGVARERYRGFGPPAGVTPIPQFTFPITLERTHHPWRGAIEFSLPFGGRVELRARYRHEAAAFYDLNEFEASVGGRL